MTRGLIPGGHCPSGSPYVRLFPPVLLAAWGKPLAWIPCHLCACSLNRPSPMPSPVSPTAVLASIPRRPSTVYSASLVSGLQSWVAPLPCEATCASTHTQIPMCIPLTCALSFMHTHSHIHAPDHTLPAALTCMPMCKHLSIWSLCLSQTHTDMPMCMYL